LFEPVYRKRLRPSVKSLCFSIGLLCVALLAAVFLVPFGGEIYFPILIAAFIALGISLFRVRGLRTGLPPPYGSGSVTRIDARRTARDGILLVVGMLVVMVGLFGSVLVVDPALFFFPVTFGLVIGLPLSQVAFFGIIASLESRENGRIYSVTEETTEEGEPVLLKSLQLKPTGEKSKPLGALVDAPTG
jgi:archaellum biogenesis protein FlaJ (TadC family)